MRLGLLTCVWKRHELARICLAQAKLAKAELLPIAVCTSTEDGVAAMDAGWSILPLVPNAPLGAKWNRGMVWFKDHAVDAVMILGSDDLVSQEIIHAAIRSIDRGAGWFGLLDCHVFDVASDKLVHWPGYLGDRRGETIGTCRTYSRRYLEQFGWKLWPEDAPAGLDGLSNPARTQFDGVAVRMDQVDGAMIDVKAYPGIDMGTLAQFPGTRPPANESAVWAHFPGDTVGKILSLRESLNGTPKRAGPPLLSACVIARDAEATIGRCLYTASRIADEMIVVVDTRSTDRTAELAEKNGARVIRREFDDFSGQRNASIRAATGTWCFVIDADEWLEDPGNVLEILESAPAEVDCIGMAISFAEGSPNFAEHMTVLPRIFRREQGYYRFPAENQLMGVGRAAVISSAILYERYDPATVKTHAQRTLGKLTPLLDSLDREEMLHALHYCARAHVALGEMDAAIGLGERLANTAPEDAGNWLTLIAAVERGRGLLACAPYIQQAMRSHPELKDLHWWSMRLHAASIMELCGKPDPYAFVPTREARWLPLLPSTSKFLMMKFGVEARP